MTILEKIAEQFFHTFHANEWQGEVDYDLNELSLADAYEVQRLVAELRIREGERIVGHKVGCTSRAIRAQFGLSEPICGRLFAPRVWHEGVRPDWSAYANCAIEPEMAIRIGKDIRREDLSEAGLLDSIDYVSPAIEIHNFRFWHGKPSLQELVCSGGIHAGLIVGRERVSPRSLRFRDERFSVYADDSLVTSAPASEIMGGPLDSLLWLGGFLADRGEFLKKDSWVIPGSPTELVEIDRDTELTIEIENVGRVTAPFEKP